MTPKSILQNLQSGLERESQFQDKPVSMNIEHCDSFAKGTILEFIEGKWIAFEVMARPLGPAESLLID